MAMVCQRHWNQKLQDFLGPDTRDHSRLSAITGGLEASKFDIEDSALVLQLVSAGDLAPSASASTVDTNRSDEKPAKRSRAAVAVKIEAPRAPPFLQNLGTTDALTQQLATQLDLVDGDEAVLLHELFRGRKQIMYTPDGYLLQRPSSVQEKAAAAGLVLQVLHGARRAVGCAEGSLDEKQKKGCI